MSSPEPDHHVPSVAPAGAAPLQTDPPASPATGQTPTSRASVEQKFLDETPVSEGQTTPTDPTRSHGADDVEQTASAEPEKPVVSVEPVASVLPPATSVELSPAVQPPADAPGPSKVGSGLLRPSGPRIELKDRLPNASVGKPYTARLPDIWGEDSRHVVIGTVSLPDGIGLCYDAGNQSLEGVPALAGEFDLRVMLGLAGYPQSPEVARIFHLTINPDPRALWKDLPSDPGIPFAKVDDDMAALNGGELNWIGASRRGRSHAHEAKPRDDDFAFLRLSNAWHIAVVSDGAGSAKFSRRGSQLACGITQSYLSDKLGDGLESAVEAWFSQVADDSLARLKSDLYHLLAGAAFETQKCIAAEASLHGAQVRDFNATYIVVIAKQFDAGWFVASFAIGDGGAGALDEAGNLYLLSSPDGGEFAGQTVFVTMDSVFRDPAATMRRVHCHKIPSLKMIALMTDGVTDPKFETDTNFETPSCWHSLAAEIDSILDPLQNGVAQEELLLQWLDFWSPGNHDDRTIVLGRPSGEPQPEAAE